MRKERRSKSRQTSELTWTLQVFIPIMSEQSAQDKQLQEQLSLAYVSNSCIFPLGNVRHRFLAPKLSGGAWVSLLFGGLMRSFGSGMKGGGGEKLKQSWLPVFWKKIQKHTKGPEECFLIRLNWTNSHPVLFCLIKKAFFWTICEFWDLEWKTFITMHALRLLIYWSMELLRKHDTCAIMQLYTVQQNCIVYITQGKWKVFCFRFSIFNDNNCIFKSLLGCMHFFFYWSVTSMV